MMAHRNALAVVAVVAVILVAWVSVAQATVTRVTISRGGAITEASEGFVTLRESGGIAVECRLLLRGSLVSGTVGIERQIGEITAATWSECRGGTVTSTLHLPWALHAGGIMLYLDASRACNIPRPVEDPNAGPASCGVLVLSSEVSADVSVFGGLVRCLYSGGLGILFSRDLTTGRVGVFPSGFLLTSTLRRASGACGETGTVSGNLAPPSPEQFVTLS